MEKSPDLKPVFAKDLSILRTEAMVLNVFVSSQRHKEYIKMLKERTEALGEFTGKLGLWLFY